MKPFRTQVKIFLDNPESIDTAAFMGVFQRWIQQKATDELLIDVADYRHVFEGPGIILIGHESDYAIETRDGRIGLLYTRKRQPEPDLQSQLRTALRLTLKAGELLQAETTFEPRLKFRTDEIEIRFADRLQLPNQPETFDRIKDDVGAVLAEVYGSNPFQFEVASQNDQRRIFTLAVRGEGVVNISELLHTFQPSAEQ